ncbi:hypothetical protein [Streptomyces vietnamensis]|uniref:hypothetical protein n=1 Tax=Streptomyces vietnamensis TaxID=362257 RepID=UPI000BFF767F|nr:hypothetical protein [Streptomyces vietnamensis]
MTEIPAQVGQFVRPLRIISATALAALVLVGCGTQQQGAGDVRDGSSAGAATDRAFTAMLDEVARSCPEPGPVEKPPGDAAAPAPTAGPEVELNARDWCASALHEERITREVWELADPAPDKVRKVLNDLGYIDERIHGLRQSGTATTFALDLRDKGGRLCVNGSVDGDRTLVEACVAPRKGPFSSAK